MYHNDILLFLITNEPIPINTEALHPNKIKIPSYIIYA